MSDRKKKKENVRQRKKENVRQKDRKTERKTERQRAWKRKPNKTFRVVNAKSQQEDKDPGGVCIESVCDNHFVKSFIITDRISSFNSSLAETTSHVNQNATARFEKSNNAAKGNPVNKYSRPRG